MKSLLLILALLSVEAMAAPNRNGNRNGNRNSMSSNNRPSRPSMTPNRPSRPSRPVMRPGRRPSRPVMRPGRRPRPFVRPGRYTHNWHPVRSIGRSVLRRNAYRRYNRYGYGNDCMDRATNFYSYSEARNICKYVWSDSCFYELDQVMSIRRAAEMCEGVDDSCFHNRIRFVGPRKAARQCN